MSKRILQNVQKYFSEFLYVGFACKLKVRFPDRIDINTFALADGYRISAFTMHSDLYVILVPEFNTESSSFASASAIYLSPLDRRPMVGLYYINFASLKSGEYNEWLYFNIFAHEFTHILGFSDSLFTEYYYKGGKRPLDMTISKIKFGEQEHNAIILEDVVRFAKTHFKCESIVGVPLENGGGDGSANSHWDKQYLSTTYMNPVTEFPGYISNLTLGLLNGTGWYIVDSFYNKIGRRWSSTGSRLG